MPPKRRGSTGKAGSRWRFRCIAAPRNRPPHSYAASEKLNSVVRVVQTGPRNRTGLAPRRGGFARIGRHVGPPSRFLIFRTIGKALEHLWNKTLSLCSDFQQHPGVKAIESSGILERAMGIEPTSEAWEASVLSLNYARSLFLIVRPYSR